MEREPTGRGEAVRCLPEPDHSCVWRRKKSAVPPLEAPSFLPVPLFSILIDERRMQRNTAHMAIPGGPGGSLPAVL
ncbi:hypothetical protein EAJ17_11680 [Akkermansia sp. aa_0143]|nr:hypothetical protein EAJ17_11680 [Akkermansia sp. aa_0143]